jgi:TetR/AcrR family transcriptional regulator, transcriptional repressor for nem operon
MANVQSKSERTKLYIIEKTAGIFNAKGYAGTTLTDLTNATGLTKGSIYGNFENKDEVALAVFDFNFGRVNDYLKTRIITKDNAVDRLLIYPEVYRNFLKIDFLQAGCPILNTSVEADDTHPLLRQKAAEALVYWKGTLENQINRGIERKEIKGSTNASAIATVIIAIIEGAIMHAKVTAKLSDLNTTMNFLEKMIKDLRK